MQAKVALIRYFIYAPPFPKEKLGDWEVSSMVRAEETSPWTPEMGLQPPGSVRQAVAGVGSL